MIVRPAIKVLVAQCLVNPDRVKIYVCMYDGRFGFVRLNLMELNII